MKRHPPYTTGSSQTRAIASAGRCAAAVGFAVATLFGFAQGTALGQTTGNSFDVPQTRLAPLATSSTPLGVQGAPSAAPPNYYGNAAPAGSSFDPYAGAPASGFIAPLNPAAAPGTGGLFGAPPASMPGGGFSPAPSSGMGGPIYGGVAAQPPPLLGSNSLFGGGSFLNAPVAAAPLAGGGYGQPMTYGQVGGYGAPYPGSPYPSSAYPSNAPSSLFPGGLIGPTQSFTPNFDPYRLIQRARFRHTYLSGNDDSDALSINDTDVALAFAIPQFLASTQPLYIAPSFSVHLWDGPESSTGADLPGSAYSAFLDFAWQSDPMRIVGAELGASVGAFSDFDTFTDDSVRVRGKGLGTFRVSPATTFKLGVYYYDRVKTKMLPAVGFFWRPDPFTKVDLFFPQPKYSRYMSTVGTHDVWWYLSGDYGGGSWTVERDGGGEDQVDINDIRLTLGFEWGQAERMRLGQRTWFFELGYVFDREIVYRRSPGDVKLDDAFLFRLGLGY